MRITQYELDDIYDPHDEPFYSAAACARANDADAHDEPFLFGSSKR